MLKKILWFPIELSLNICINLISLGCLGCGSLIVLGAATAKGCEALLTRHKAPQVSFMRPPSPDEQWVVISSEPPTKNQSSQRLA